MEKHKKIGLIGCPGCGKTNLAFKISESLKIPFLSSRSLTQKILDRDKYDYASGIYVERFLASKDREFELVESKISIEKKEKSFVADRTTLEQFAYALLQIEQYEDEDIIELQDKCYKHMSYYTHLFYFQRKNDIKQNGVRTTNKWFQMKVDYIICGLLKEWGVKYEYFPINGNIDEVVNQIVDKVS